MIWNTVPLVTSGVALAAFAAAATVELKRRKLISCEKQIALAPENDRLAMAQAITDSFLILGKPVNTDHLTKEQKFRLLMAQIEGRQKRFYVMAISALLVAVCGTLLATSQVAQAKTTTGSLRERTLARQLLEASYARDYKTVYASFPEQLKAQMPYALMVAELDREFNQFPHPPVARRIDREVSAGTFWTVTFVAEFDRASAFRETVTFVKVGTQWEPYRIDVVPAAWQMISTTRFLPLAPADVISVLANKDKAQAEAIVDKEFKGFFTPYPGWKVVVQSVTRRSEESCDVESLDQASQSRILLRGVLGICRVQAGDRLQVLARLSAASQNGIELEDARIFR